MNTSHFMFSGEAGGGEVV